MQSSPSIAIGDVSIVLLGHFNPMIFSAFWLAENNLVQDRDAVKTEVMHADLTAFQIGSGISVRVEKGKFWALSQRQPWVQLSDFIVGTFHDLLNHTPIHQMGINRQVHVRLPTQEHVDRIGQALAPREPWGAWGRSIDTENSDGKGGMRRITMEERPADRKVGHFQCTVEPSSKIKDGIYIGTNDHYAVSDIESSSGSREMIDHLISGFEASIAKADALIEVVASIGDE